MFLSQFNGRQERLVQKNLVGKCHAMAKKKLHPIFYLYVTCMAWSGQKMHLPNVTSWHIRWYRSQLTVTHLLCDQCMDERSQLIMHAN